VSVVARVCHRSFEIFCWGVIDDLIYDFTKSSQSPRKTEFYSRLRLLSYKGRTVSPILLEVKEHPGSVSGSAR
jgi:hypothetical protein